MPVIITAVLVAPRVTIADFRPALRQYLLDDAAIAARVADRVFAVRLRQGERRQSIVFSRISGLGDHHMQGSSGLSRPRVQIDCWAASLDVAVALANLVKARIDGFRGSWFHGLPAKAVVIQGVFFDSERESYDDHADLYRMSRDYFIWYAER